MTFKNGMIEAILTVSIMAIKKARIKTRSACFLSSFERKLSNLDSELSIYNLMEDSSIGKIYLRSYMIPPSTIYDFIVLLNSLNSSWATAKIIAL